MSAINVRFPDSLHRDARELAKIDNTSLNQLIVSAVSEKVAILKAERAFEAMAARGSKERLDRLMAKIPNVEPDPHDRLIMAEDEGFEPSIRL